MDETGANQFTRGKYSFSKGFGNSGYLEFMDHSVDRSSPEIVYYNKDGFPDRKIQMHAVYERTYEWLGFRGNISKRLSLPDSQNKNLIVEEIKFIDSKERASVIGSRKLYIMTQNFNSDFTKKSNLKLAKEFIYNPDNILNLSGNDTFLYKEIDYNFNGSTHSIGVLADTKSKFFEINFPLEKRKEFWMAKAHQHYNSENAGVLYKNRTAHYFLVKRIDGSGQADLNEVLRQYTEKDSYNDCKLVMHPDSTENDMTFVYTINGIPIAQNKTFSKINMYSFTPLFNWCTSSTNLVDDFSNSEDVSYEVKDGHLEFKITNPDNLFEYYIHKLDPTEFATAQAAYESIQAFINKHQFD